MAEKNKKEEAKKTPQSKEQKKAADVLRKLSPKEKDLFNLERTDALLKYLVDREQEILQAEDALVESMRRFRDLFEQSPIGVGIHDPEGELLIVNRSYLKIFGLRSFGDIKQQNLFNDFKLPAGETKKVKAGKVVQRENEYDFTKLDLATSRKDTGHFLFTISPLSREKNIIGHMVQVQDITQRKKVEESNRLAQLGRLLSDMAHEVNNPLMVISGNSELLLMSDVKDQKVRDTLNVVLDQCFLAKDILQRFLKYSRLGKVAKKPLDVRKEIDLITDILGHHFHISNIKIMKDIQPRLPLAMGNEKQIQEVFMNLIRNSSDSMPDGGAIVIRAKKEKSYVRIEVQDTGEGMPEEVLDRVFEPFFTTKQTGTGLGLAVCHTVIHDHGGDLRLESTIGKGTKAIILLPIA